jgi:hypothetical protein
MTVASKRSSEATPALDPVEIVATVERDFEEAYELLRNDHPEMALVRAVASFEWFIKRAVLQPYFASTLEHPASKVRNAASEALLRGDWQRIGQMITECWDVALNQTPQWETFSSDGGTYTMRSKIVHAGARCQTEKARKHIDNTVGLVRTLLTARIDARHGRTTIG